MWNIRGVRKTAPGPTLVLCGAACALAQLCAVEAFAQRADSQALAPGPRVERELSGGQSHEYRIALEADQFTVITTTRHSIDVVVTIADPDGQSILNIRSNEGSIAAQTTGEYLLRVQPRDSDAPPGRYAIRVEPPRHTSQQDSVRASADTIVGEGDLLLTQAGAAGIRNAIERYTLALARFREAHYRPGEARTLLSIGDSMRGLPEEARSASDYLNQALELARAIGDRSREAGALLSLGSIYRSLAESGKALDALGQALTLYDALGDERAKAAVLTNLGALADGRGDDRQAIEYFDEALALSSSVNDRAQTATTRNSLGIAQQRIGDLPAALHTYDLALPLARAIGNRPLESMIVYNTGVVHKELGDYRRALDFYGQSLEQFRRLGNAYREAQVLNAVGNVHRAMGQSERALEYYDEALPIFQRLAYRADEAAALNNRGAAYSEIGEYRKALEQHLRSHEIRSGLGDTQGDASALNRVGAAWHKLGEMDMAVESLAAALEIRRRFNDPISEAETLANLAAVERDRGNLETAKVRIEAALKLTESVRARIRSADLRASYIARVQESYESYVDILMRLHQQAPFAGYDAAALQTAERSRARVLLESLGEARADIHEGVDPQLLSRERALQAQLDAASARLSRSLSSRAQEDESVEARKELDALTTGLRDVEAQLRSSSPRYAALTQPEPLTVAQIQEDVLDNDTVLLEFALGADRSWLWAVTQQTMMSVPLARRSEIEAAARDFYDVVTARQPRPGEVSNGVARRVAIADQRVGERATMLTDLLFSGIAEQLRGPWRGKRLVIVASGALEYLPFAALPLPPIGAGAKAARAAVPLIARHQVVEAASASVLATLRRETAGRTRPLRVVAVLADPVFEAGDPRVAQSRTLRDPNVTRAVTRSGGVEDLSYAATRAVQRIGDIRGRAGLARLPFSRDEATAIAALSRPKDTLSATDFAANRGAALGAALADYRIVHFATHGLIDSERPELSGLVLSLVTARGAPQDGFLRLYDIFNMRLNADLVVLSACQTALGKEIKGEGLVGLTRAFMYAGAPRVVASLWQVSDLATAELMKRFYAGMFKRGLTAAAALRAAQLEMSADPRWAPPYFWAGFVLQGDWR